MHFISCEAIVSMPRIVVFNVITLLNTLQGVHIVSEEDNVSLQVFHFMSVWFYCLVS